MDVLPACEAVQKMEDNTEKEKQFYYDHSIWGRITRKFKGKSCWHLKSLCFVYFSSPPTSSILGILIVLLGLWALFMTVFYVYSAIMLPFIPAIIYSVLLTVVGMAMVLIGMTYMSIMRCSGATKSNHHRNLLTLLVVAVVPFAAMAIVLGIATLSLIINLPEVVQISANITFANYLNDQNIQESWNTAQLNLECCGVMTFSDYEDVFNNFSVPVSCCNTTNPLANKTTCRESIVNAQEANQSNLIYSEGCVSQLLVKLPWFEALLSIAMIVTIVIGLLLIAGAVFSLKTFLCKDQPIFTSFTKYLSA